MSEPPRPTPPSDPNPQAPRPSPAAPHHGITESPEELRQRNLHDKEQHDDAKSAAMGAAVGLGCLALPLLPWVFGFLAFVIIVVIGFMMHHHPH
jgi:hypothetical protein